MVFIATYATNTSDATTALSLRFGRCVSCVGFVCCVLFLLAFAAYVACVAVDSNHAQVRFAIPRIGLVNCLRTESIHSTSDCFLCVNVDWTQVLCLRSRSAADDLEHYDDDFCHRVRHIHSTGSSFATGSDVKKMAADMTSETVCLRLNGLHSYRGCPASYLSDTSTTAISVAR